jgi:hypothetical protein
MVATSGSEKSTAALFPMHSLQRVASEPKIKTRTILPAMLVHFHTVATSISWKKTREIVPENQLRQAMASKTKNMKTKDSLLAAKKNNSCKTKTSQWQTLHEDKGFFTSSKEEQLL